MRLRENKCFLYRLSFIDYIRAIELPFAVILKINWGEAETVIHSICKKVNIF